MSKIKENLEKSLNIMVDNIPDNTRYWIFVYFRNVDDKKKLPEWQVETLSYYQWTMYDEYSIKQFVETFFKDMWI